MSTINVILRISLSVASFCVIIASIFTGWVYVQNHRDEALLRDFVTQKINPDAQEAEFFIAPCGWGSLTMGECSALRIKSRESVCQQMISKLRGAENSCTPAFFEYNDHVFSVRPMGYSEKPGYFVEVVLMEQHYFNNAL